MTSPNNWKQLNIYLTEGDRYRHGQLYLALVETARKQGLAGTTVTRAITGFGASRTLRTTRIFELSVDLPLIITIIDREEALNRFMPTLREMLRGQLVTLQPIEVLSHTAFTDR